MNRGQESLSIFAGKKPARQLLQRNSENSFVYGALSSDFNLFNYADIHELHSMQLAASMYDLVLAPG